MGKRINSKNKGNQWERDVSNRFKILFEDEGFERNAFSGSLYGGSNRYRMKGKDKEHTSSVCGDLITPNAFPFSIECKAYKDLDFHNIINGSCTLLDEWIEQAEDDAQASNKEMLIVIKINNKGKYVCTHDLMHGPNKVSSLENVTRYKADYCFYSYALFEEIVNRLDIVHRWNINKGREVV